MSEPGVVLDQKEFCCSICLNLLKDPVAVPCGHNYCMGCINSYWDQEERGKYSCPQCRTTFTLRPLLRRNTLVADVVEKLKRTKLCAAPPDHCYAGAGDVACDVCTGRKLKGLKSCLVCLASYCERHLQPHLQAPAFRRHKLVQASARLQEKICPRHGRVLELFCRTDQQCVCYQCTTDQHEGHETVVASAERTQKQSELDECQQKVQQRVQERQKNLKELQQADEAFRHSAQAAVEASDLIFTELMCSIQRRHSEVTELIRGQQEAVQSQTEGVRGQLEQELKELRRRDAELRRLSGSEDDVQFFQSYRSLSSSTMSSELPHVNLQHLQYFGGLGKTLSTLADEVEDLLKEEWPKIATTVKAVNLLPPPEPKTRSDFLGYSCRLNLDPNTVHGHLSLSEGNRKVTYTGQDQRYPGHPERFTQYTQVLCREGLSGRCYWEVQCTGMVLAAVSYKDISRASNSGLGHNDKSWAFRTAADGYEILHNNIRTKVEGPQSSRIGVYLDHSAGTLSFYSVSNTVTLLHILHTTFTQPLHPGFVVLSRSSAELCELE